MLTWITTLSIFIGLIPRCDASFDSLIRTQKEKNPQRVDTWIITGHETLEIDAKLASSFDGEFERTKFEDLESGEQDHVVRIGRACSPIRLCDSRDTDLWLRDSSQTSIWKRCGFPFYLISYHQNVIPFATYWIIGAESKLLRMKKQDGSADWKQRYRSLEIQPWPNSKLSKLRMVNKNCYVLGKLQKQYEEMQEENQRLLQKYEDVRLQNEEDLTICTWLIRDIRNNLDEPVNVDVFGFYRKRKFQDLTGNEQQDLVDVIREIAEPLWVVSPRETPPLRNYEGAANAAAVYKMRNPGHEWHTPWYNSDYTDGLLCFTRPDDELKSDLSLRATIWRQRARNIYLISYKRAESDFRKEILWILCTGNQVLWSKPIADYELDQFPKARDTYFELVRIIDNKDSICELHENFMEMKQRNLMNQEDVIRNATTNEMEWEWRMLMRNHSELRQEIERAQNRNQEVISNGNEEVMTIGIIGCAVGLVLIVMLIVLFVCRFNKNRRNRDVIRMMKEYKARYRAPGSIAVNFPEMDPRFRCSRDPHVAALNHAILAEGGAVFGLNQIDEVIVETEQEGIDVSAVTQESTVEDEEQKVIVMEQEEGSKEQQKESSEIK